MQVTDGRQYWRRLALLVFGFLGGCTPQPGSVSVRFEWASTPPTEQERASLWAHVFVEESSQTDLGRGAILGTAVASLVAETQLTLDKIPNGANRVFIVEIRNGPDRAASDVRYFGRSEVFELSPGQDLEVGVALRLSPTPQIPSSAGLSIIEASADGVVATTVVTLRLVAANATLINVAKDLGFTKGVTQTNAAEARVAEDPSGGSVFEIRGLNLDDGLCTGACPDGLRTVFVQVSNDAGYASAVQSITVRLDRTAPSLIDAAFSPPIARRGTTAFLSLNFDEPVAEAEGLELLWEGADPGFRFDRQSGLSQVYSLSVDAALGDASFVLRGITVKDHYGNAATLQGAPFPIEFEVDATSIALSGLSVSPTRVNETGLIEVQVSLDEPPQEATVAIGDIVLSADSCGLSGNAPELLLRCTYAMTGLEVPLGFDVPQPVVVEVADAAGNRSSDGATVVFDFRDPGLTSVVQSYVPSPSSPLPIVDEVTAGTTIVVDAIADELLDAARPPTMWATSASSTLTFTLRTVDGARMTFEALADGTYPDGELELFVALTDVAGNGQDVRTGQLVPIRTSTPTLVVQQSQIRFLRSPWGFDAPQQVAGQTLPAGPSFQIVARPGVVPSAPFSFADGRPMRELRFWAANDRTGELARVSTRPSQPWAPISLADVDVPFAFVSGVDAAGNESEPQRVEQTLLAATPRATGVRANPNQLNGLIRTNAVVSLPAADGLVVRDLGREAEVLATDGDAFIQTTERFWRQRRIATRPPDRLGAAVAYEMDRGRLLLFGGLIPGYSGRGSNRRDLWALDGDDVRELFPAHHPPGRREAGMAYDPRRRRTVLFGGLAGQGTPSTLDDLWEFDGLDWHEVERTGTAAVRPLMWAPQAVFDPAAGEILLFPRRSPITGLSRRIWVWDGHALTETLSDADPIMFAGTFRARPFGCGGSPVVTYEWTARSWAPIPAAGTPPTRCSGASAYDPTRDVTVFINSEGTWEWDGSTWSQVSVVGRDNVAGAVFDPRERAVLAYTASEVLVWRGGRWIDRSRPGTLVLPPIGSDSVFAFHPTSGHHLLLSACSPSPCSTLWAWNGSGWRSVQPPSGVVAAPGLLALDGSTGRLVIVDDATGSSYGWDGGWTLQVAAAARPQFLVLGAPTTRRMAYDLARGSMLVAWSPANNPSEGLRVSEIVGSGWSTSSQVEHQGRRLVNFALAFAPSLGQVILDGGGSFSYNTGATYGWTGTTWNLIDSPPYSIYSHSLVWDSGRSRMIRFGGAAGEDTVCGAGGSAVCPDIRELVGGAFSLIPSRREFARHRHSATYDENLGAMVVWGGYASTDEYAQPAGPSSEVWEWHSQADRSPAIQLDIDFAASSVPADSIDSISVTARTGGESAPFDQSGRGAVLQVWLPTPSPNGGPGWATVASIGGGIDNTGPEVGPNSVVTWSSQGSTLAQDLSGVAGFHCQLTTIRGSDVDGQEREARLALDAIWVEVVYR